MSLTDRLRRRTVAEKYIPGIDGFRFAAILSVVLLHIFIQNPATGLPIGSATFLRQRAYLFFLQMVSHGARGVPLFFVISGFILAIPFARYRFHATRPVSLSFYFLRRVTRLEPPYILILLIRLPLLMLLEPNTRSFYVKHFLASLFYLHNLIYAFPSAINFPAWSLEIEIQFYCLVPLLAFYFAIERPVWRRTLLLAFIAMAGIIQVLFLANSPRAVYSVLVWIQYFLAGFFVADLYLTDWHRIPSHWLWELTLPLWVWFFVSDWRWIHAAMPFAIIVLFLASFKGRFQRHFFSHPVIAVIGGMCYSLYLTHNLVLSGMGHLFHRAGIVLPVPLIWTTCLASVLAFGTVYYLLIERPCMDPNWPKRLWRRMFPQAIATADPAV